MIISDFPRVAQKVEMADLFGGDSDTTTDDEEVDVNDAPALVAQQRLPVGRALFARAISDDATEE